MAMTLKAAAEAVGMNKVTILRSIQKGKISAIKNDDGEWLIEPSELFRVYTPIEQRKDNIARQQQSLSGLEAQITALNQMADLLRAQLSDIRDDRDHWRDQAMTALRQLPIVTPPPPAAAPQRSWWNFRRAG